MDDQEARGGGIYLQGRVCILGVLRLPGFSWIEWPLPKIEGLGLKLLSNSYQMFLPKAGKRLGGGENGSASYQNGNRNKISCISSTNIYCPHCVSGPGVQQ